MTVSLGGITLSNHLHLTGLESGSPVAVSQKRTVAGIAKIRTAPMIKGRQLTLTGKHHFYLSEIKALQAVAANGGEQILIHPRGVFNVVITGFSTDPTINYSDLQDGDRCSCDITMIEV